MNVTLNLPRVTKYQSDAIFAPERNVVIEATTKAGKTYGCILWMLHEAGKAKMGEGWWVAPIFPQTAIAYRRMCKLLESVDKPKRFWKTNMSDMSITLANGVVIRFKSGDNPDSLFGEDVFAAVIDEASRCKDDVYGAVRTTLTATNGRLRIIGNVKGRQNWAYQLARKVEGGLQDWHYAKITCYDAVKACVISEAEVDAARRELPNQVFRELYEGIPSDDGGNPFGLKAIADCILPMSMSEPVVYGIDLAKSSDWTVCIGLDNDGAVCSFDRWQAPWRDTTRRLESMVGSTVAIADSTGVGDPIVEQLQASLPNVTGYKFTRQSKQQLMEGLAYSIQNGEVRFPDGVIRNELEVFTYEYSASGVKYTAPEGLHDDCVCSLALALYGYKNRSLPYAAWGSTPVRTVNRIDEWAWGEH